MEFSVRDTGPGIASEDLPHIFDRFWQARKVARAGVGLGEEAASRSPSPSRLIEE